MIYLAQFGSLKSAIQLFPFVLALGFAACLLIGFLGASASNPRRKRWQYWIGVGRNQPQRYITGVVHRRLFQRLLGHLALSVQYWWLYSFDWLSLGLSYKSKNKQLFCHLQNKHGEGISRRNTHRCILVHPRSRKGYARPSEHHRHSGMNSIYLVLCVVGRALQEIYSRTIDRLSLTFQSERWIFSFLSWLNEIYPNEILTGVQARCENVAHDFCNGLHLPKSFYYILDWSMASLGLAHHYPMVAEYPYYTTRWVDMTGGEPELVE